MKKVNSLKTIDIKKYANEIRELFNIKLDSYFPILDVLETLLVKKVLSYQILDDDNPIFGDNEYALYLFKENFIYIKECVIKECEQNIYRSNFTLCHELFHFIQFEILNFSFEEVDKCKPFEDADWQANEFAGEVLVPDEFLNLDNETLVQTFHVSEECVLTRKLKQAKRNKKNKVKLG